MDIHNWIVDIRNWIMDNHNSIVDRKYKDYVYGRSLDASTGVLEKNKEYFRSKDIKPKNDMMYQDIYI